MTDLEEYIQKLKEKLKVEKDPVKRSRLFKAIKRAEMILKREKFKRR